MARGMLEVLLANVQGIRDKDFLAKMNPYVVIRYGNQECTSSVARGEGKKRVWNEKLTFNAEYPGGEDHKYKLTFQIMDNHKTSHHVFVGETTIYVKDVVSLGVETGKAELRRGKYRVVLPDNTYSGEICVAVTFTHIL
ncbi:16 kDa phloem protein 1-like [Corylus avellana]|uniref:16 kDa phloem protein 1-like n=1 Tax=Corylus avellana TaxID=13451 RepID=UPI001E214F67|nr:16 kDa phloem protein 1-like [Corylus avellana]